MPFVANDRASASGDQAHVREFQSATTLVANDPKRTDDRWPGRFYPHNVRRMLSSGRSVSSMREGPIIPSIQERYTIALTATTVKDKIAAVAAFFRSMCARPI